MPAGPGSQQAPGAPPSPARAMTGIWIAVLATAAGCYALKLAGLTVPQRVLASPRVRRFAELVPVALLAALSAVQTPPAGTSFALDPARLAGLGAAVVALLLRAPFLLVIVVAAGTAAALRAAAACLYRRAARAWLRAAAGKVRRVTIGVEVLGDVTDEVVEAFGRLLPQLSSSAKPLDAAAITALAASPAVTVLLARCDGRIAGSLTLAMFPIPTGLRAWIEDVVVDDAARGQGIGAHAHPGGAAPGAGSRRADGRPDDAPVAGRGGPPVRAEGFTSARRACTGTPSTDGANQRRQRQRRPRWRRRRRPASRAPPRGRPCGTYILSIRLTVSTPLANGSLSGIWPCGVAWFTISGSALATCSLAS